MKNRFSMYLLVALSSLFFTACSTTQITVKNEVKKYTCASVKDVIGTYQCSGTCVITSFGKKEIFQDKNEINVISYFPDSNKTIYKNDITSDGFKETEIGVLTGLEMRAATSEVSDKNYPVLEEYIFKTDEMCKATGFTKVVLNPMPGTFKACNILCEKH